MDTLYRITTETLVHVSRVLKFGFITSRVPINKMIRPTDEVIMMNNDETYDEIGVKTASNF